jgi:hypothetical protein
MNRREKFKLGRVITLMPEYSNRRWAYRTRNTDFSRGRGGYGGCPRGARYSQGPQGYQGPGANINIVVGRKRIWIFNNTKDPVIVEPGQYIVLEIVREGDNQLGHFFRTVVLNDGKAGTQTQRFKAPEERVHDWV